MSSPARRFYKTARAADDGAGVMLDERRLRTPKGQPFNAPTRALAEAIAAEWQAQGEHIVPATMPLTQLAFAAIEHTPERRDDLIQYIAKFGETDLACHRVETPPALVARQSMLWDPLIGFGLRDLGIMLPVVTGVLPAAVPRESLETLAAHAGAADDFRLTVLAQAAGLAGSALVAFALINGRLDAEQAFAAAALDDLWAQETWGRDEEAAARLDRQRAEFENIARFIALLND